MTCQEADKLIDKEKNKRRTVTGKEKHKQCDSKTGTYQCAHCSKQSYASHSGLFQHMARCHSVIHSQRQTQRQNNVKQKKESSKKRKSPEDVINGANGEKIRKRRKKRKSKKKVGKKVSAFSQCEICSYLCETKSDVCKGGK